MRLCRYRDHDQEEFGIFRDSDRLVPIADLAHALQLYEIRPRTLLDLLPGGQFHELMLRLEQDLTPILIEEHAVGLDQVKLLTPLATPGKLLFLAGNYPQHVEERGGQAKERAETFPYLFMKPNNTLTHPGDPIRIPQISPQEIDWEVELAVVIGKDCSQVSQEQALDFVAGYTVINDISDRSFHPNPQRIPRPRDPFFDWLHGKWHDTFCPMGPCILPANECPDPQQLCLKLTVNDTLEQDGTTADMIFPVAAIIEFVSSLVSLNPGDVIATGTPAGVGKAKGKFLRPGDLVVAKIDKIGSLQNPVV
jgi:2-keto-4-pentenoate hydratase/2-oxohepta-3-ene-1,7-dioic acid hydratase in catechol pathway